MRITNPREHLHVRTEQIRIGIDPDIYGNLPALEAALEARDKQALDQAICASGLVSYGFHPQQRERLLGMETNFLKRLPTNYRSQTPFGRFKIFHGNLQDPAGQLDLNGPLAQLPAIIECSNSRLLAVGGGHVPFYQRVGRTAADRPRLSRSDLGSKPGEDAATIDIQPTGFKVGAMKIPYDIGRPGSAWRHRAFQRVMSEVIYRGAGITWS